MKLLHTSDWHLGQMLYDYDRLEEHRSMMAQLAEIVRRERPDVFLVSGDIYHHSNPSAAAQRLFSDGLVRIHEACLQMCIVVTAGNHDSGSRVEAYHTPFESLNIHLIGDVDKQDLRKNIVEVPGKAYVVAVPYTYERSLPDHFFQDLLDEAARMNAGSLPVILSAHLTVGGCDYTGHEDVNGYMVGGIEGIPLQELGTGYDYLALGHIHRAQFIPGSDRRARYSGTPVPVSFDEDTLDEKRERHSVSLVTVGTHGELPQVETLAIDNPHPLVTLPAGGPRPWEEVRQELADFPADIPAYLRLNVLVEDYLPATARHEAEELVRGKSCRLCYIQSSRKTKEEQDRRHWTMSEFQQQDPLDIVKAYAGATTGGLDAELEELFKEAVRQVKEENRNNQ